MQPLAFVQELGWNPKLSCDGYDIPRLDLRVWGQEKSHENIKRPDEGSYERPYDRPNKRPNQRPNKRPDFIPDVDSGYNG